MPARIPMRHKRGDRFQITLTLKEKDDEGTETPVDLTGKRIRMMIRADKDDRVTAALADLGNDGGRTGIVGNSSGQIIIDKVLDIVNGNHDYDIEISTAGNNPKTHFEGKFKVSNDATF